MPTAHFLIVGSGLIGTSIALALVGNGHTVELEDADADSLKLAKDLVGKSYLQKNPDFVKIGRAHV